MKIAILGPKGTYSDIACKKYLKLNNLDYECIYLPSILKTALAIDDDTYAILPFENTLDGFVIESLDQIANHKYHIISQVALDIDFSFVSNTNDLSKIKYVYSQFKAMGQCLDFISNNNFNVITTQSNTESAIKFIESNSIEYAAIIPNHLVDDGYKYVISHIADSKCNQTRFFIVSNKDINEVLKNNLESLVVVTINEDRAGILYELLKEFHDYKINMNSIMSRPMKTTMGKYKFIIECSLKSDEIYKLELVKKNIEKNNIATVDILGVYNSLK